MLNDRRANMEGRYWLKDDPRPSDPIITASNAAYDWTGRLPGISFFGGPALNCDVNSFKWFPVGAL